MKDLSVQLVKFGIVGVSATATHVVIALWLVEGAGIAPCWGNLAACSIALFVTYIGNHQWTFAVEGRHGHTLPRFLLVATLGLGLNQGTVVLVVDGLGWDYRIALALVVTAVPAITFTLNRGWALRAPNR